MLILTIFGPVFLEFGCVRLGFQTSQMTTLILTVFGPSFL
jgi:hypothetical protein